MTEVNKGRVGLLVAALRSGLYSKGESALHEVPYGNREPFAGKWCCLGVAGDVARRFGLEISSSFDGDEDQDEDGLVSRPANELETIDGNDSYMTRKVVEWYGFPVDGDPAGIRSFNVLISDEEGKERIASIWNDVPSTTFADIADGFERTYLKEEK